MTHPPRCSTCGKVPPIRRLGPGEGRITFECCGEIVVLHVERLPTDRKLNTPNGSGLDDDASAA